MAVVKILCKNGHPWTLASTGISNGYRYCRKCKAEVAKKKYHEKKEKK